MPPISEIKTIEHMIFYQYAKIMAKSAFGHKDGKEAKAKNFGFIRNTVRKLINGKKNGLIFQEKIGNLCKQKRNVFIAGAQRILKKSTLFLSV